MTRPGIETRSSGSLANTLLTGLMSQSATTVSLTSKWPGTDNIQNISLWDLLTSHTHQRITQNKLSLNLWRTQHHRTDIKQLSFFVRSLNKYKERENSCTFLYINFTSFFGSIVVCYHFFQSAASLHRGKTPANIVLDMTLNNLMARLQP